MPKKSVKNGSSARGQVGALRGRVGKSRSLHSATRGVDEEGSASVVGRLLSDSFRCLLLFFSDYRTVF